MSLSHNQGVNSHYIARSITKYWEIKDRFLICFDFSTSKFNRKSSKSLFSQIGLFNSHLEDFFNFYIEDPLAKYIANLLCTKIFKDISKWETYRALYLLFLLQAPRTLSTKNEDLKVTLKALAEASEKKIDEMIRLLQDENRIVLLDLQDNGRFFFTEKGFFPLLTADVGCLTGYSWSYCFPVHPQFAFILTSKTASVDFLEKPGLMQSLLS